MHPHPPPRPALAMARTGLLALALIAAWLVSETVTPRRHHAETTANAPGEQVRPNSNSAVVVRT